MSGPDEPRGDSWGTGATTAEILSVLGPDGKVVGVDKSPAMLAVAAESVPDRRVTGSRPPPESICRCLGQASFAVERIEEFSYAESAEAKRAWLSIPIFTKNYLPGLPYHDRIRVLDQTYQHVTPSEPGIARWVAFGAQAAPEHPGES